MKHALKVLLFKLPTRTKRVVDCKKLTLAVWKSKFLPPDSRTWDLEAL